jgi:hypothetical protein
MKNWLWLYLELGVLERYDLEITDITSDDLEFIHIRTITSIGVVRETIIKFEGIL